MMRSVAASVLTLVGLALMAFELSLGSIGRDGDVGSGWAVVGLWLGGGVTAAGLALLLLRKRR